MAAAEEEVRHALKGVVDPEIGLNIIDLGLVYDLRIGETGDVDVVMTMTTPGCPLHDAIEEAVQRVLTTLSGVGRVRVELVWSPPWSPEMITDAGRATLGWG